MNQKWKGFYAIVDPEHCVLPPLETAAAILRAGPTAMQLRWKNGSDRQRYELGLELRKRCNEAGVPFVMNDRFDLALLTGADGLHLGQDDLPIEEARRFFKGPIGVSTHNMAQAKAAGDADLIGFGPVFDTSSKANPDATVGLRGLESICANVEVPVVAIGGITVERAKDAFRAGAAMVAAISSVCAAKDPFAAAQQFVAAGAEQ
ncbi:MAG: thiamine-phosphate pyrophosphorylase [Polyangiales bacterium]